MKKKRQLSMGWCSQCRLLMPETSTAYICAKCGGEFKPSETLTETENELIDLQIWFCYVSKEGRDGHSPVAAAKQLGCTRSMIDHLVKRRVLEKEEIVFRDRKITLISQRSLDKAKQNRAQTGNWTGHPVRRGK